MKTSIFLLVLALTSALALKNSVTLKAKWQLFKEKHGKSYFSAAEELARYYNNLIKRRSLFLQLNLHQFQIYYMENEFGHS